MTAYASIVFAALALMLPAALQGQTCFGQNPEVKPAQVCPNQNQTLQPKCVCSPDGLTCRFQWICLDGGTGGTGTSGWTTLLPSPPTMNPAQAAQEGQRRALEIQRMQLENEKLRQQIELQKHPNLHPFTEPPHHTSAASIPATPPTASSDASVGQTSGLWNGVAWGGFSFEQRLSYVDAVRETLTIDAPSSWSLYFSAGIPNGRIVDAITVFYADRDHQWVPMHYALFAVRLGFGGTDKPKVEEFLATLKKAIDDSPKAK